MSEFAHSLRRIWLWMFEPPWRHSGADNEKDYHWLFWLSGWAWAVAGLVLGAFVAPALVQHVGLVNTPYQDSLVIGVAVVAGFLAQLVGWCLFWGIHIVLAWLWTRNGPTRSHWVGENNYGRLSGNRLLGEFGMLMELAALLFLVLGFALYRYLTWVGPGQSQVITAFVGGLLVKTFLIPFIKGIVTGALFRRFMRWLRGDKVKASGA
jgi:hypothetical protein